MAVKKAAKKKTAKKTPAKRTGTGKRTGTRNLQKDKKPAKKKATKKTTKKVGAPKRRKGDKDNDRNDIDPQLLLDIEDAVAEGAKTNKEIAEALGWGESTFKYHRYGRTNTKEYDKFKKPIEAAIKKGTERAKPALLRLTERSIAKMITGYTYPEVHTETKRIPITRGRGKKRRTVYLVEEKEKTIIKRVLPNAMVVVFTAVNCGKGKWESINKLIRDSGDDREGILKNIEKMLDV